MLCAFPSCGWASWALCSWAELSVVLEPLQVALCHPPQMPSPVWARASRVLLMRTLGRAAGPPTIASHAPRGWHKASCRVMVTTKVPTNVLSGS